MSTEQKKTDKWLDRKLERRSLLKKAAIGGASLAVLYVAPKFTSVGSKPAYASITAPGKISIEFTNDDITVASPGPGPHTFDAQLCNVSGWHPTTITSWDFSDITVLAGGACLDTVGLPDAGNYSSLMQVCGDCAPGVNPTPVCELFQVVLNTNDEWDNGVCGEIKVRIIVKVPGTDAETTLTVTITQS